MGGMSLQVSQAALLRKLSALNRDLDGSKTSMPTVVERSVEQASNAANLANKIPVSEAVLKPTIGIKFSTRPGDTVVPSNRTSTLA